MTDLILVPHPRTDAPRAGTTRMSARLRLLAVPLVLTAVACRPGFQVRKFPTNQALYVASYAEFKKGKFDNAVTGFERLTLDLAARDTLLPLAHYYLGKAHDGRGEHLLAAQSYSRIAEQFPDDTLADDALMAAGDSYLKMWRNPELDPSYGTLGQAQYRLLQSLYPDSPLSKTASEKLDAIDEEFATKDYETGRHYVRRKAFDSAIIYFKDVVKNYPNSQRARDAMLRMVEVYRRPEMNYKEEATEMCAALRAAYPAQPEVKVACPEVVAAPADAGAAKKPAADSTAKKTGKPSG